MKTPLIIAAVGEIATGLALMIVPSLVGRLLLGAELRGVAIPTGRVLGIALIALGVACWSATPRCGMLTYSAAVTAYLLYLALRGEWVGLLLWPAVAGHTVLTLLLGRAWFTERHGTKAMRNEIQ